MKVGDQVEKVKGYKWPGEIVSVFTTKAGKTRVVVECTVSEVAGALHIYSPEQIRVTCDHDWRYTGTDYHGSHKGEDNYDCSRCGAHEYRN